MAAPLIDWDLAVRIATRFAGDGPSVSRTEAEDVVTELRDGAERSTGLVKQFTGLDAPADTAPVLVVDRAGWAQANADGFATLLAPIIDALDAKKQPSSLTRSVGAKVTGAEVGALLGFLSSKVLGQFDPFYGLDGVERRAIERPRGQAELDGAGRAAIERPAQPGPSPQGRLLLVAPNIVQVERELGAVPGDFRLWVCLHEETHRVQFTATPWLRDHLSSEITALGNTFTNTDVATLLDDGVKRVTELIKGGRGSLIDAVSTPEQREILDRITAVMSLLEGHADVVMDGVGPSVIPSVESIRKKFTERRKGVGTLDKMLRRVLGLDAKMAQYRDGAKFVRSVVRRAGMADFNAVFAEPANLPSLAEIHDPRAWTARVLKA